MKLHPCPLCGPPFDALDLRCAMCCGHRVTAHTKTFDITHFQNRDLAHFADHSLHVLVGNPARVWTRPAVVSVEADTPTEWKLAFAADQPLTPADAEAGEPVTGIALSDAAGRLVARRPEAFGNYSGGRWTFTYSITVAFGAPHPLLARYRKKPVEVEAARWEGPWVKLPGVFAESAGGDPATAAGEKVSYYVVTIHGQKAYLSPGDWVITESNGTNHYPCQDSVFRATYDRV